MMQLTPTWTVTLLPHGAPRQTFRVPETNLREFLDVLIFNGVGEFNVEQEDSPIRGQVESA